MKKSVIKYFGEIFIFESNNEVHSAEWLQDFSYAKNKSNYSDEFEEINKEELVFLLSFDGDGVFHNEEFVNNLT